MSSISRKNQVTIPKDVLTAAGLSPGDDLRVKSVGPGRIEFVKSDELISEYAGIFDESVYPPDYLQEVRRGWP